MKPLTLLFLAPHWRVPLIRAFREAATRIPEGGRVVCADSDPHAPALCVSDAAHPLPLFSDPECASRLRALCEREAVRLLLPQTNKAVEFLNAHRAVFEPGGRLDYLPGRECIELCHDKLRLMEFLRSHSIPVPQAWDPESPGSPEFPLIAKPRRGEGGKGVLRIESHEDLQWAVRKHPDHLIQKFIVGREFTIDWFSGRDGAPRLIVPRERIAVRGGEVAVSRIRMDPALIEAARGAGTRLGLVGPCTLQGIIAQSGEFLFTDVNLRFGSGTIHTLRAGGDIPGMIFSELAGKPLPDPAPSIQDGSIMTRFSEAFFRSG